MHLEHRRADRIQHKWAAIDPKRGIIAPLIGITNLDVHRGEFFLGRLFGRVIHPIQRVDSIGESRAQIVDQLERARFRFRREIIRYIKFPESFTDCAVRCGDDTLPTRLDLLRAAQGRFVEVKVLVNEVVREF